ncbi:MAG: ATP-binding cassette domain-containing protein [Planctomycetota bacterium]
MSLQADCRLQRGAWTLDLQLEVAAGETTVLLGPNGAGKSSVLAAIAGLLPIQSGQILLNGQTLDGGPSAAFVPAHLRRMGVLFQDLRLLPHLSALQNVAYPARCGGANRKSAEAIALDWLTRFEVPKALWNRRSAELSGGQAQRIALARAFAAHPACLLLDEPLSAADPEARRNLRALLLAELQKLTGPRILVLHNPEDTETLAQRTHSIGEPQHAF